MFDVANSGYTTVVLTTIFNAYFVAGIAADLEPGTATLLWTAAVAVANAIVLVSGPVVGAIADARAAKKRLLLCSTIGCVGMTVALGFVGEGGVVPAMLLVIGATVMFATGENLIAAFLPEICDPQRMGRLSGYGWGLGYLGGLMTLAACLAYISHAEALGHTAAAYVSVTLWLTAGIFRESASTQRTRTWYTRRSWAT